MFEEIVKRIKNKQQKTLDDISYILPDVIKFQKDLVENLKSFITLAKENDIGGTEFLKQEEFDNGVIEYTFQMAYVNYILVTINRAEKLKPINRKIGNYSFIYFDGDETFTPFIKISIFSDSSNNKLFSVVWINLEEEKVITSELSLDDNSGIQAAKAVINFIYGGENFLNECPSREAFHKSTIKKGRIGFLNEV